MSTRPTKSQARVPLRGQSPPRGRATPAVRAKTPPDTITRPTTVVVRSFTTDLVLLAGVLIFLIGGTWDISWHIVAGRETFWSPPHLVLYAGILVILGTAVYGLASAWRQRRSPSAGAIIGATGAGTALASAPLDEFWHRVYGLDVTVWSPPHLLLIGGIVLATFGGMVGLAAVHRLALARRGAMQAWQRFAAPWAPVTGWLIAAGGLLIAVSGAAIAEYDFDVARFTPAYHPPLLALIASFGLTLTLRASRRVGGATLTAAAYTLIRVLLDFVQRGLQMPQPQIPLILIAAPIIDLLVIRYGAKFRTGVGTFVLIGGAGGLFAAVLLLVQWPYTTAFAGTVWSWPLISVAALPTILFGVEGAIGGWAIGARLGGPLVPGQIAPPVAVATTRFRFVDVLLASSVVGLAATAIAPAVRQAGVPSEGWVPNVARGRSGDTVADQGRGVGAAPVVGYVELRPPVPLVGQPLTVRVGFSDATVLQTIGRSPAIPFESPRAGDVAEGVVTTTGTPGAYEVTFTPRQAGRRWMSLFVPGEFGRMAASTAFTVYAPGQAPASTLPPTRALVLRPEPGPDEARPDWLEPVARYGIGAVLLGAVGLTWWAVRRER